MIQLVLKRVPSVPLEAEVIRPDRFAKLGRSEVGSLTVYHGKRQFRLDEFFDVEGEPSEHILLRGDLSRVRWIGRAMTRGTIQVHGSVGMHLGAYMRGGKIDVQGDAGDWVGAEMKNGEIRISGNAGGQIGGAYRGSSSGMKNGLIHVQGTAGLEVGVRMRRGTIVIGQLVRDFAGLQMKGGTIVLLNGAELRTGAWMSRGTIISLRPLQLMPTFACAGEFESPFINVLGREMNARGIEIPYHRQHGSYLRYLGDKAVLGKGEILVWQPGSV